MKNIRVFYKKYGALRFVSHLDMYRLVIRLLRRAGLSIWHTEGYNQRPYVTFALPLSLGFTSSYECFDFKLCDELDYDEVKSRIAAVAPSGLEIFKVAEPLMKTGKIVSAEFTVTLNCINIKEKLNSFLLKDSIIVQKTSKKGTVSEINIAEKILKSNVTENGDNTVFTVLLPAGGSDNLNPTVVINEFLKEYDINVTYTVNRTMLYANDNNLFI